MEQAQNLLQNYYFYIAAFQYSLTILNISVDWTYLTFDLQD